MTIGPIEIVCDDSERRCEPCPVRALKAPESRVRVGMLLAKIGERPVTGMLEGVLATVRSDSQWRQFSAMETQAALAAMETAALGYCDPRSAPTFNL